MWSKLDRLHTQDPEWQYYTVLASWLAHHEDSVRLVDLLLHL